MATSNRHRVLVLGLGGVSHAVLGLLSRHPTGLALQGSFDKLFLLDEAARPHQRLPQGSEVLPPRRIESGQELGRLVRHLRVDRVVDLSSVATLDCVRACDALGVSFLTTSVEGWDVDASRPTHDLALTLLPERRPSFEGGSHLVGSGMNPGIVNALAHASMEELARRVGVAPTVASLELEALYVTEVDTTEEEGASSDSDVFPMSWSPRHCLTELLEPEATVSRRGRVVGLGHRPHQGRYTVRCGDEQISGMVIPHEEVVTLGARLRVPEVAFVYRLCPGARGALRRHPNRSAREWRVRPLYPPHVCGPLRGYDRVGVLLVSRRFGELWMGFETDVAEAAQLETNATELQVAAGVLAGFKAQGAWRGLRTVEELDWRAFLEPVKEILGPLQVVYRREAPARKLAQRRVRATTGESSRPTEKQPAL